MKLSVIYHDLEPHLIERPPTLTGEYVTFRMNGTTAVHQQGDATDLPEVVDEVEQLPFVQAVEVGE